MKWNKKTDVFALMVGHGKSLDGSWDSGCVYEDYTEAGLMLKIVTVAVKWLRRSGVKVISDSDDCNNRNMKASVAWANQKKAKLYMSVHCDYKLASAGVAPLYVSNAGRKMASSIGRYIATGMGMTWKGAYHRTDLYELNATNMTSVIMETGAIKADLKYLKDYKKYGKVLAKAICHYIGVDFYVSKAAKLRRKAKAVFAVMTEKGFKYQVSKNAKTWKGAKKKKTSNCATYVSYVMQVAGFLKAGQVFWCNGGTIKAHSKAERKAVLKQLRKVAEIIHPNCGPAKADLKKGDICGYSKPAHTQIFAGYDKKGDATWYSFGPSDVGKKEPRKRGRYNTKKIDTIIRLK